MKFKCLALITILMLSSFAHALYNGQPATGNRYSAIVSMDLVDPSEPKMKAFCAGVVISSTKVLTAGHCVEGVGIEVYDHPYYFPYHPNILSVNIAGKKHAVKAVTYSSSYFEYEDLEGEDVAVIELVTPTTVTPIKLGNRMLLKKGMPVELVARGKSSLSKLKSVKHLAKHSILQTEGLNSGVCVGDSGGALLIENSGQLYLAGILAAEEGECTQRDSFATFPSLIFEDSKGQLSLGP